MKWASDLIEPVDVLVAVEGDVFRADYSYHLYSAIKSQWHDIATRADVWIGRLEDVIHGRIGGAEYVQVTSRTALRIRCEPETCRFILGMSGQEVRISNHLLRFGSVSFCVPSSSRAMWCESVSLSGDNPTRREFTGALHGWLRRIGDGISVDVGQSHKMVVGDHSQTMFSVGLRGLDVDQSRLLTATGIGGRRNMGAGMFRPGRLPAQLRVQ